MDTLDLGLEEMTFFLYLLGLLLISTVALAVSAPLFTQDKEQEPQLEPESEVARWEKQKADAYSAIREAEFDRQMGKLTDEDYQLLRERYETRAIEALAQLDRIASGQN